MSNRQNPQPGRRSRLEHLIATRLARRDLRVSMINGLVVVNDIEVPVRYFEENFEEAISTLLDQLRPAEVRSPLYLGYSSPELPERRSAIRYAFDPWEMHS